MLIDTKSVKFGDCNIICGISEKLLVDCGSANRNNGLKSKDFAYSSIENEINNNEITDILISHFDNDHFNGVLNIPDTYKVNNIYLPYSIIDGKIIYSTGIGRLLAIASPRSWGFNLSKSIISLFEKIEKLSTNIHFIKKGDLISFDNKQFRVLWPDVLLNKTSVFSSDYDEESLTDDFNRVVGEGNNGLIEAMMIFIDNFHKYLVNLHEYGEADFSYVRSAYSALNEQRLLYRDRQHEEDLEAINTFSLQQYHSLISCMNAISIVFDYREQFIFLGDAPIKVIDYIKTSFCTNYKFVKIQHHGTEAYFTKNTPIGDTNLISNGGWKKRSVSGNHINQKKIKCTNAHNNPVFCNFYNTTGNCSTNCTQLAPISNPPNTTNISIL